MRIVLMGGAIVNEGRSFPGDLVVEEDRIAGIFETGKAPRGNYDKVVDAAGCFILPGVIDEHVHFREPGMAWKADIESESRAAAWGGVTSYFEMPNTNPQTTTIEALEDKFRRGKSESHVNYSFFFGATRNNAGVFRELESHRIPGVKLFMGASTGNMVVEGLDPLRGIFRSVADANLPLMTHCEDTGVIRENMAKAKAYYGADPPLALHPLIRNREACWRSTRLAVDLALETGVRLHVAHVSTARELSLVEPVTEENHPFPQITFEACVPHLWFSAADYVQEGTRIKCNPAVKGLDDRAALRTALTDGRICCVGTDHAPHLLKEKEGGCVKAASGMPMVQFSLVTMLELVDAGVLPLERIPVLMAHHPARLFGVRGRGFLRPGYQADLVVVRPRSPWKVTPECIQSKCQWSPVLGQEYHWQVEMTFCNGHLIYNKGRFDPDYRGEEIIFDHE